MNENNKSLLETISEHLKESDEVSKQTELPPVELKAIVPGLIDQKIELAHLYNEFRLAEQRVANGTLNEMEPGARYIRDLNIRKIEIIREKFDSKFKDLLGVQDISEIEDLDEAFAALEEAGEVNSKNLTHWAVFLPKEGSEQRDHIALPVDGTKNDKHHTSKFKKVFGKDIAAEYRLDRVEPKGTNEEVEQIDDTFAVLEGQTPAERLRWAGARRIARKLIPGAGKMQARKQEKHEREQAYYAGQEYVQDGGVRRDTKPGDDYWDTNTMANRHHKRAARWGKIAQGKSPFKEEVEQVDEAAKSKFVHAKEVPDPKGLLDKPKAVKAYDKEGALVGRYRSMNHAKQMKPGHTYKVEEEVEQVEEKYMGFKKLKAAIAAKGGARDPAAVAAAIGRKKYGKEKFQAMAAAGKRAANEEVEQIDELKASTLGSYVSKASKDEASRREQGKQVQAKYKEAGLKNVGIPYDRKLHSKTASRAAGKAMAMKKLTGTAKVAANEEAEGKIPQTPREKKLAAHHGDPKRITYGDVIKARIKSGKSK